MGLFTRRTAPDLRAELAGVSMPVPWPGGIPTRAEAWEVPAVASGLQIYSVVSTFDLYLEHRTTLERSEVPITRKLDPFEPLTSTMWKILEDLILFPRSYCRIMDRDWTGRPSALMHYPYESVVAPVSASSSAVYQDRLSRPITGTYQMAGEPVDWSDVFVIESPTEGLLEIGAETIKASREWDAAANRIASFDTPTGILKNNGADIAPEKVDELLDGWEESRATRTTAYLSSVLDYEAVQFDATQLGLQDARDHQTREIARLLNLPPVVASINAPVASSQVYRTMVESRRDLVDVSYAPYIATLEGRLSDLVSREWNVRLNVDRFLRADVKTLSEIAQAGLQNGFLTVEEVRRMYGRPPEPDGELKPLTDPAPVDFETDEESEHASNVPG